MDIRTLQDLRLLVQSRRKSLGLSQNALAERAGVSRRWVSMFETGHETAEIGRVLAVLQALGLHLLAASTDASTDPPPVRLNVAGPEVKGLRDSLRDYDQGDF